MIVRRVIAFVLIGAGLVSVGLAVASATIWRAPDTLTASYSLRPESAAVVLDPGVLELEADEVTIHVTATDEAPLVVAMGRDTDVIGWVGQSQVEHVTGLTSSGKALTGPGPQGSGGLPSAAGSDLWISEVQGSGSVNTSWERQPGRWSLLVSAEREAGGAGSEVAVSLTWPQVVTTPYLWPGVAVGAALLIAGAALLATVVVSRRRAKRAAVSPQTMDPESADSDSSEVAVEEPGASSAAAAPKRRAVRLRRRSDAQSDEERPATETPVSDEPAPEAPSPVTSGRATSGVGPVGPDTPDTSARGTTPSGGWVPSRSSVAERLEQSVRAVDLPDVEGTGEITITRRQLREAERTAGPAGAASLIASVLAGGPTGPTPPSPSAQPGASMGGESPRREADVAAERWRRAWSVPATQAPETDADDAGDATPSEEGSEK